MFQSMLVLASLATLALALAHPLAPSPKGCPAGSFGIGESQLCPSTGSCAGFGLTATIYEPGSCKAAGHVAIIGDAGVCGNAFSNGAVLNCTTTSTSVTPETLHVPGIGDLECVDYDPEDISCDDRPESYSSIFLCCGKKA